ncbi:hypothetical protein RF11_07735 [Thelohanellus kitauei]|uniref:Uncharacterized protein n=1 Tax=Thelohanellus kitauei TaxID=669202 RepID=A0A0C2N085_THEKT|nr:hypothetical protein RF11_07735 [Thelohanellus kitauei]
MKPNMTIYESQVTNTDGLVSVATISSVQSLDTKNLKSSSKGKILEYTSTALVILFLAVFALKSTKTKFNADGIRLWYQSARVRYGQLVGKGNYNNIKINFSAFDNSSFI